MNTETIGAENDRFLTVHHGGKVESSRAQRRLLASNAADAAGRGFTDMAIELIFVVVLGASALDMGLLNALGTIAFVAVSIPAGYLVDRWGALKVLRVGMGTKLILLVCLLILSLTNTLTISLGLVLATLLGVCNVFGETSQIAAVPAVDQERMGLNRLIAQLTAADQALGIIIPAVAGTVFSLAGAPPLLIAAGTLFSAALWLACLLPAKHLSSDKGGNGSRVESGDQSEDAGISMFGGLQYLFRHRTLLILTAATALCNLGLAIGSTVEGLFIINELGFGAQGYGFFAAVSAVGGLLGAYIAPKIADKHLPSKLALPTVVGQVVFAGFVLLAGFTPPVWSIMLLIMYAIGWGLFVVVFNVAMTSWVVEITPERLLGRVMSARRLFTFGVVPLGSLAGGFIGDGLGIRAALLAWVLSNLCGLICLLILNPQQASSANEMAG